MIYYFWETPGKGNGIFASRDIKKGELLFHIDLTLFDRYSLADLERFLAKHPELDGDHTNYAGHGKYVLEDTPASFMNHSCDPNCVFKMRSISVYDVLAYRNIKEGEELTHDYTACSVDQYAGHATWVLECRCGSENCRGQVRGDFFEMPEEWQSRYYPYLPPSIRRKYKDWFLIVKPK